MALKDIDVVVHLAAVVSTPITFDDRPVLAQVNNWGTAQLVDACLASGVQRMIYASTTAVYGTGGPFTEEDGCQPLGSYAQSKWDAERVVAAGGERGLDWTILRFGSLFGLAPVVRFDTVANRFAYLAGVGRTLPIFGAGKQRRPLVHVQDASSAIVHALVNRESFAGGRWNIVAENPTIDGVADAIRSVWPETRVRYTDQQVMEHLSLEVSGTAAEARGWTPRTSLSTGLEELLAQFGPITQVGGHSAHSSRSV
jgi:UDP-glucose 4-epimerase